ncbi:MAG: carbon monoxide dehydrogenase [Acidobacteria bacterium]|nr:carbon monoxide dehydrogenase [Acidobacteriota bacterium]
MDLNGSYSFNAPPERVFDLMVDPKIVAACLPGCEQLEALGENRYRAVLSMGIAAITGRYEGVVELQDLERPVSYKMLVEGKGKPGFVKGGGEVRLSATESGTKVEFSGKAQVGGAIARVGQRLMGAASKVMTDKFFACLESKLAEQEPSGG